MAGVTRRGFLAGSGLVVAGVGVTGAGVAMAGSARGGGRADCDGPAVETFGTASQTASIVGATVHNGHAYVVTRGQTPPVLAEIDLGSRKLTRTAKLGSGDGAWGVTAAGDYVYAGTYSDRELYRFHIPSGEVEHVAPLGTQSGVVWCLTTTPNGKVYAGTYPDGKVWGYDPRTGDMWDWPQAADGEQYVRTIAADAEYVYAGTLSAGHLIRFSRVDGAKLDITPDGYGAAASILVRDGRVLCAMGLSIVDLAPDGTDVRAVEAPGEDRLLDAITVTPDGTLYCVGRPSGTVFRRTGDALEPIAAPTPDNPHSGVFALDDQTLAGAAGSGILWWLDLASGESETLDLLEAGVSGPELVQSVAYGAAGVVHVGGNSSIWTHRPANDEAPVRTKVAGEPKQLREVDGLLYAAMYPSSELLSLHPGTGEVTSYGRILNGQSRPHDMEYVADSDLLLIGSGPSYGPVRGALTVLDRSDHTFEVYPNVVPEQSVTGVAVEAGVAYLCGDVRAVGSDPVASSATIVAFDLGTREVLWEVTPYDGNESLQHIAVHEGVLYGLYKRPSGSWFAMDVATQEVLRGGELSHYGELTVHDGQVFASVHGGSIYRLGPDLEQAELMLDGLEEGWYTAPKLAFEPSGWHAWGLSGRDLARLRLDPSC